MHSYACTDVTGVLATIQAIPKTFISTKKFTNYQNIRLRIHRAAYDMQRGRARTG